MSFVHLSEKRWLLEKSELLAWHDSHAKGVNGKVENGKAWPDCVLSSKTPHHYLYKIKLSNVQESLYTKVKISQD